MNGSEENRILCVDWGKVRIGLAISDQTRTIARPLKVINHVSRHNDAKIVLETAKKHQAGLIIIGVTLDEKKVLTPTGRSACRFAEEMRAQSTIPIEFWDEDFSTASAKSSAINMGLPKEKRKGHLDAIAAAIILQNYLDIKKNEK